jgi:hypothetical protein
MSHSLFSFSNDKTSTSRLLKNWRQSRTETSTRLQKNILDAGCIARGYEIGVDESVDKRKAALTAAVKY